MIDFPSERGSVSERIESQTTPLDSLSGWRRFGFVGTDSPYSLVSVPLSFPTPNQVFPKVVWGHGSAEGFGRRLTPNAE